MKDKILKLSCLISAVLLAALFVLLFVFGAVGSVSVYAETAAEVLQDLRKDKDFDESAYPYVKDDYSLQVIQIAESSNKRLFVYAYQPCHDTYDLVGTKISISYGYSVNGAGLTPKLYNLRLISTSGTLDKYYVDGFTVPNDGDRYYNIVEIFRMVNTEIDEIDESFPKTDIAYSVGQQWYACDLNDSKHYEMNTFDTLYVETVFAGNAVIKDGLTLGGLLGNMGMCDVWFYCFNVEDFVIKHIYDADLNYSVRDVRWNYPSITNYSNERVNEVITLTDTSVMTYSGRGLGSRTHVWDRILSSENFISVLEEDKIPIEDTMREKIKSSQWIFIFLETERTERYAGVSFEPFEITYSDVYDVGLLRLSFLDINDDPYDLGVVNSLVDPDNNPDIEVNDFAIQFKEFWEMFVKVILTIAGIILLAVLLNFVTPVMGILKFIFKGIAWVISAPFKLIKSIFKKDG